MKSFIPSRLVITLTVLPAILHAQAEPAMPEMPSSQKQHEWLNRFVGTWETEAEIIPAPDQPPLQATGIETVRSLGGFWIVADGRSEIMGQPFLYQLTLGYDAESQKYVGTWVDSMSGHLWTYEGAVDSTGDILTLEAEGPCPHEPDRQIRFREVTEFKSDDHRVFTSSMQEDNGEWTTMLTVEFRRQGIQNSEQVQIRAISDREIALVRTFDAPRERVFEALTTPELLKTWMTMPGWSLAVAEIDLQVGGEYRFVQRSDGGAEMGWGGVYREIVPNERIVHTEKFDQAWYPGEALVTANLVETNGKTTLTTTIRYESQEARDAVLSSPMEGGLNETYNRLDALLAE